MLEIRRGRRELALVAAAAAVLTLTPPAAANPPPAHPACGAASWPPGPSDDEVLRRFLDRPDELNRSFRVRRHLEVTSGALGKQAWMDVVVELDAAQGFRYAVTGAGGSEMLQERILRKILGAEQEVYASGTNGRTSLTSANYAFALGGRSEDGLVCLAATARRKEVGLLNGRFLVSPHTADIVEVSGTMARGPSFWIPRIDMVKRYARVKGHRVNVRVESVSHVRLLGESRFTMTSAYEQIEGDPVSTVMTGDPPASLRGSVSVSTPRADGTAASSSGGGRP